MHDFASTHQLCETCKADTRIRILTARRAAPHTVLARADLVLSAGLDALVRGILATQLSPETGVSGDLPPTIAGYVPLATEPGGADLPHVLAEAVRPGRLILPVLRPDLDLDWAEYTGPECLARTDRGLYEPTGERLGPDEVARAAVVVVPAVAVDHRGVRLGRGGGSYDRALARVPDGAVTVVPLYEGEYVDRLPAEPHDRRVRMVVVAEPEGARTVKPGQSPPR